MKWCDRSISTFRMVCLLLNFASLRAEGVVSRAPDEPRWERAGLLVHWRGFRIVPRGDPRPQGRDDARLRRTGQRHSYASIGVWPHCLLIARQRTRRGSPWNSRYVRVLERVTEPRMA